ncbi:MAG: hypothetical protein ACI9FB_000114 [Candidatus Azotimanducaceae bacterium]
MSEILEKLKNDAVKSLSRMLQEVFDDNDNNLQVSQNRDDILMHFMDNMNAEFDKLQGINKVEKNSIDFETLTLIQEDELSVMVAIGGMVSASRNMHLPSFISFNTRLNSLFTDIRIDESTNPLDPQQIASSFSEAVLKVGIVSNNSLDLYRSFNNIVLKNLDKVLRELNKLLIDHGVIPDLRMDSVKAKVSPARNTRRSGPRGGNAREPDDFGSFGSVEEDPYHNDAEQPELFSMMQNLMRPGSPTTPAENQLAGGNPQQQYAVPVSMLPEDRTPAAVMQPFQPAPGEEVQMVDQAQLIQILTSIQGALEDRNQKTSDIPSNLEDVDKINISESLGEILQESQKEGVVSAVDQHSSDIINLVTLLYDAIWQDESVPIPIKELIGRTQITIIKVALSDTDFFNRENHPARRILNEFASAGIGWTAVEKLAEDPLYREIESLVNSIQRDFDGENVFFENLIKKFRSFLAKEAAKTKQLEQRIMKANERQERVEDIRELVTQKINERVLGRDLHPFVTELLNSHFHKFMVMLVLKEGPGSNAWKQSINTIDVLLWSVQPHEQTGDKERLETVNPRLLNNLRKALRIAKLKPTEIDETITTLKDVQEATFISNEIPEDDKTLSNPSESGDEKSIDFESEDGLTVEFVENVNEKEALPENDPVFAQVDALAVGMWVEFNAVDEVSVRCKLAAKINAIDKFIFVNRQGVKVIEKTRVGLATELKCDTVKIISDGLLFSRALESVIGNLRETQHEQQTGGAYQPEASQSS